MTIYPPAPPGEAEGEAQGRLQYAPPGRTIPEWPEGIRQRGHRGWEEDTLCGGEGKGGTATLAGRKSGLACGWAVHSRQAAGTGGGCRTLKALSGGTAAPIRPPKRRRRQALTRGLAAVCSHLLPNRYGTQHARPIPVGRACVYAAPKALLPPYRGARVRLHGAKGAVWQAPAHGLAAVCPHLLPNRYGTQHARPLPVGRACVFTAPKALAGGTAAPVALPPYSET